MNKVFLLQILVLLTTTLFAKKNNFEEIRIIGVENPVFVTISPDGLKMIIIDWPKKSYPILKQTIRTSSTREWGGATEIPEINDKLNSQIRITSVSYGYDSKNIYFAGNLKDTKGGLDIYYSEMTPDGFADPVNLGSVINSERDENYPSVSGNNRILLFTRNVEMKKIDDLHPGEIWRSNIHGLSGNWSEPEKINIIINDAGVGYPKIYNDNKTLFYSRVDDEEKKWRIHWTKMIGDIHWYLPFKMDTIKSNDHEISPIFCKQDGYLYFIMSSDLGSSPKGNMFRFKPDMERYPDPTAEFTGTVYDSLQKKPLEASVLCTDPVLGRIQYFTNSGEKKGNWFTLLPAGSMYLFHIWKENYSHSYRLFSETESLTDKNFQTGLTNRVVLQLNIYDKEELWPLDAEVSIMNEKGIKLNIAPQSLNKGQLVLFLPIGSHYMFNISRKDYQSNRIDLDLSSVVLFDRFIRDIELEPVKRSIEIFVTEKDTIKPLKASIELIDLRKKRLIPDETGIEGLYKIMLREGEPFNLEVRGPKFYAFKNLSIDLDADRQLTKLTIELSQLTRKVPIRLNNINFELNSSDLMESSLTELNRVVRLLKDNPEIYVEMSAHTCDIGSDRFNDVLSDKRAKSVVNYMILKGIDTGRMVARGYGEKFPLFPNINEENRALNRRVELKILDKDDQVFQVEEKITG